MVSIAGCDTPYSFCALFITLQFAVLHVYEEFDEVDHRGRTTIHCSIYMSRINPIFIQMQAS